MSSSPTQTIAILTASSTSGAACLTSLLSSPHPHTLRAIFRTEAKAAHLRASHPNHPRLEIFTGVDAHDPPSLVSALSGCTIAFLVTPHDPAKGMQDDAMLVENMIRAAVKGGVKHVIFGASWTVRVGERVKVIADRFNGGEQLLKDLEKEIGLNWTVLRGGFFYDNYVALMGSLRSGNEVRFVDFCVPANDPRDIGRVAAVIAEKGGVGYEGSLLEISGPERVWLREAVSVVGEVLGREVVFVAVGIEEVVGGLPRFLGELFEYLADVGEEAVPISEHVEKVTGRKAVAFKEWLVERKELFGNRE